MSVLRGALLVLIAACGSTSPAPAPSPSLAVAAPVPVDASPAPVDAVSPVDAALPPVAAPPPPPPAKPLVFESPLVTPADLACKVDRDCVVVHEANCCDCANGGTGVVVNRRHAAAVTARIRKSCGEIVGCATVLSSHPTCLMYTPVCFEHGCALSP